MIGVHKAAVFGTQEIFEKDSEGKGKMADAAETLLFEFFQAINLKHLRADVELVAGMEGICCGNGHSRLPFKEGTGFYDNRNHERGRSGYNETT